MNATVKKYKNEKNIQALVDIANGPACKAQDDAVEALIDIANSPKCGAQDDAELALASLPASPSQLLSELLAIAMNEGRSDLMDAVLDNPNLPAQKVLQFA